MGYSFRGTSSSIANSDNLGIGIYVLTIHSKRKREREQYQVEGMRVSFSVRRTLISLFCPHNHDNAIQYFPAHWKVKGLPDLEWSSKISILLQLVHFLMMGRVGLYALGSK